MAGFTVTFEDISLPPGAGEHHFDTPPWTYNVKPNGKLVLKGEGYKIVYDADFWIPPVVDDP